MDKTEQIEKPNCEDGAIYSTKALQGPADRGARENLMADRGTRPCAHRSKNSGEIMNQKYTPTVHL